MSRARDHRVSHLPPGAAVSLRIGLIILGSPFESLKESHGWEVQTTRHEPLVNKHVMINEDHRLQLDGERIETPSGPQNVSQN